MKARTMIYLEPDLLESLKTRARSERVSLAELFRRLAKDYLSQQEPNTPVPPEVYLRLVGLGTSDRHDVSERHDDYIGEAVGADHER